MILGTEKTLARHAAAAVLAVLSTLAVALPRFGPVDPEAVFRRSLGASAFLFLFLTLALGPLAVLFKRALRWLPWRRELGVWFFVLALAHALFTAATSFNWNLGPTISSPVGLPNLMGLAALAAGLLLAATSTDRAVAFLGIGSWKWLHYLVYAIFYLVLGHLVYFVFISSRSAVNRAGWPYLLLAALVLCLQAAAFAKIVRGQRARLEKPAPGAPRARRTPVELALEAKRQVAEDTWEVSFSLGESGYRYQAGQYAGFRLPRLDKPDDRGAFRVLSFVSAPGGRRLEIAFRVSGSGFKQTLLALPPGTPVSVGPPSGYLLLPPADRPEKLVFVAGGIGVTPFVSLMRAAGEKRLPHPVRLITSNRSEASTPYRAEIERLAAANSRFTFRNCLEEEAFKAEVRSVPDPAGRLWYLAGPVFLVAGVKDLLLSLGVAPDRVLSEEFVGY